MMSKLLSIVIPTFNRGEILYRSLNAAAEAVADIDAEIIVVNDSKTSEVVPPPRYPFIRVLKNPKSGVASVRNLGASVAEGKIILFIDDDCIISKENVTDMIRLISEYPDACFNLNWVYPPELIDKCRQTQFGRFLIKFGRTTMQENVSKEIWTQSDLADMSAETVTSQCLFMRKETFDRTGGYNENFPHAGFEDYVFSKRLSELKLKKLLYKPGIVYHNEEDRTLLKPWLRREKSGAITRKVGVQLGYKEIMLHYPVAKKFRYAVLAPFKPFFFLLIFMIPNLKIFDFLYFKMVKILLGITIYQGYYSEERKKK